MAIDCIRAENVRAPDSSRLCWPFPGLRSRANPDVVPLALAVKGLAVDH